MSEYKINYKVEENLTNSEQRKKLHDTTLKFFTDAGFTDGIRVEVNGPVPSEEFGEAFESVITIDSDKMNITPLEDGSFLITPKE